MLWDKAPSSIWALTLGGSLALLAIGLLAMDAARALVARRAAFLLARFFENDAAPSFVTDTDGALISGNPAARLKFQPTFGDTLTATLRGTFADPAPILFRLQGLAEQKGSAREDIVTRGGPVRLSVQKLQDHQFLWRIEAIPEHSGARRSTEALPIPVMTASKSGAILSMNDAARDMAGGRVTALHRIFPDLPLRRGELNTVLTANGIEFYGVLEHSLNAGRREIILLPQTAPADESLTLETLPVALLHLDLNGEILDANSAARQLLGKSDVKGQQIAQLMEGLGRPIADWLEDTASGRKSQKSEVLRLKGSDLEMFLQVTLNAIVQQGETRLVAVLNDATELKSLEAQFVQSQKMQAIGQLAGGVAHDFNNLLTAISGHCDLLLLRHDQGDEDYADLMQINENANRAASLVGQLLAFSRKQTLRPEILDVRDTLSDLTHLLNRLVGEKVTLTLSHDPVLGAIRADKRQLEQVLMNLVVNARDAMPEGGEIRIVTEALQLKKALKRNRVSVPPGDYVSVKVIDQGTGIAPDLLQKVFEPFYTTKRTGEGTGLGLSTAYGIVKQTGGYIFADSVQGQGTTFLLIFPVRKQATPAQPDVPATPERRVPKHGNGVVLLVEDEAPVRAFASRALRLRGYTVIEADSAESALQTLEDRSLSVDVFVTDVVMPGLDGPTWVKKALEARPDVRVVFVSGYAEGAFDGASSHIPQSVFLQKPFSLNQLTDVVHDQLAATA
nr:ATP-binding protein [Aestuariivita boseongensis]